MQPSNDRTTAYVIQDLDNVATTLREVSEGQTVVVFGSVGMTPLPALCTIPAGHKIALNDIAANRDVIKFGIAIGYATTAIAAGEWVHLHNCSSHYDARSATLNAQTGETQDTVYE